MDVDKDMRSGQSTSVRGTPPSKIQINTALQLHYLRKTIKILYTQRAMDLKKNK